MSGGSGRKQEIIGICLETFMSNGLSETTMRDLGSSIGNDPAILYRYFRTKDDIVIACAEEAKVRIENELFYTALDHINDPEMLNTILRKRAVEMRPLMRFFVSVCALPKYETALQPLLDNLSQRYKQYAVLFAEKLRCEPEAVAPYMYIVINTMLSYMLFGRDSFTAPQIKLADRVLRRFIAKRDGLEIAPQTTKTEKTERVLTE